MVAAGQIERVLEPSLEVLGASDVGLVRDVVIEVDIFRQILFARMHPRPAGKHGLAAPASAARGHEIRHTLIGISCAIRLIRPLPASVSIGAPASTRLRKKRDSANSADLSHLHSNCALDRIGVCT
jgi:hypothetical protein